jgi:hypothetical protein
LVTIKVQIKKFGRMGEKTGWSYVEVSVKQADKIKADYRRSYKVKGTIDGLAVAQLAMIPMGNGSFIIPVKTLIRKKIGKQEGDKITMILEEDKKEYQLDKELIICLKEEPDAFQKFSKLPRSYQNYYSKWAGSAKTPETKSRRIGIIINGMIHDQTYAEMLKVNRDLKER